MAILTRYTVHVALLPDPSLLTARSNDEIKPKTYMLGPTSHVTTQSAIVSALWHPLGVNGTCLVTVTEEAVVRVWELSTSDRWSFDRPALAIDLKRLVDGTSTNQDFSASKFGATKAFSPDSFEMEVASACFGSRGSGGWSPMTLWVAMREGDVYALCPLLPEKWTPPPALIPSLSVSIVQKTALSEDDVEVPDDIKRLNRQQLAWMADLDNQEPAFVESPNGGPPIEVYSRPRKPGKIPRLQGPFDLEMNVEDSDNELDSQLSDIYVIGTRVDSEALMEGEEAELEVDGGDREGLSLGIVCLLASSGRLTICLDLDGVQAQWLPDFKMSKHMIDDAFDIPTLLTFQILDTLKTSEQDENNWAMFSQDVSSRYSFFVTNSSSVTYISLVPWVFRLEGELQGTSIAGVDFRLNLLSGTQSSIRERLLTEKSSSYSVSYNDEKPGFASATVIQDPDLGYFILTTSSEGPLSLNLESPYDNLVLPRPTSSGSPGYESDSEPEPETLYRPRPVYQPSSVFETASNLPGLMENIRHSKHKMLMDEPVRLSPATLSIFTDAHKLLSEETYRIGLAAAELFRRCEELQTNLREQITRANEVANRVEQVTGNDVDDDQSVEDRNQLIEQRIKDAEEKQQELVERLERLKKKAGKGGGRPLSDREKVWIDEAKQVSSSISPDAEDDDSGAKFDRGRRGLEAWRRFEDVKNLKNEILAQVDEISERSTPVEVNAEDDVPSEIRRGKVSHVMTLLERETALVDATKNRLEKLSVV
jgi:nucleoporin NUP82